MENGIYKQLIETLMNYKGIGFISLQYRNKEGELSKRLINLGARIENAKNDDLKTITNGIHHIISDKYTKSDFDNALMEIKQSLIIPNKTRSNGQKNAYITLNKENGSVKYNINTKEVYLFGKSEKKEIIEKGQYKIVKSSPKTLAKNDIKKHLKTAKFRTFILKNVCGTVKINKQIIVVDGIEKQETVIDIVLD